MKTVTVNKEKLKETLNKNMINHIEEYNQMHKLYLQKALEKAEHLVEQLKSNAKGISLSINLQEPTSHESDYILALDMLNMDVSENVTISDDEFKNYVNDDWYWTTAFSVTKSHYGLS